MMKSLQLIPLFLIMPFSYGQDSAEKPNIPKNLIYGSFGSAIYKYTYNFFYERTFISEASSSAGIRLGGGYIEGYTNRGSNFNVQLVVVAEGLELGLGMTFREYAADKSQHKSVAFNLGYRGFTKNRVFLYRFGVSLPEAVYVGVGFGFGKRTN